MRDENCVKCRGFDKSQISAALSLAANSVLFDAKNAGNCISVLLYFKFFLGEHAHGSPPPPLFGTVSETSGSLGTKVTVANMNKTNMAGGSEHGGREQNECLTRLLFKS